MFIVTLSNGKVLAEGKDVENFDQVPDEKITSMQLLLPHEIKKDLGNNTILKRKSTLSIGRYDRYYCAKQAIANVMSISGDVGQFMQAGQGQVIKEVLAGIDDAKGEVVYIDLTLATGDVHINKFDLDTWIKNYGINPSTFKKGAPRK